jgi:hypothetical protein
MKKTLLVFSLFVFTLGFVSQARAHDNVDVSVSIGMRGGYPVYVEPQPYYAPAAEPVWLYNTPAEVIYVDGAPHYMHLWQGQWYDEAWIAPSGPYYHDVIYYRRGWDHYRRW